MGRDPGKVSSNGIVVINFSLISRVWPGRLCDLYPVSRWLGWFVPDMRVLFYFIFFGRQDELEFASKAIFSYIMFFNKFPMGQRLTIIRHSEAILTKN